MPNVDQETLDRILEKQAALQSALTVLYEAAGRYLRWKEFDWTDERDHLEWQRLSDAVRVARPALELHMHLDAVNKALMEAAASEPIQHE